MEQKYWQNTPESLYETVGENRNIVVIGGGSGAGMVSTILYFAAPCGDFVIWISLRSRSLHTDQFWKAFCRVLRVWSNVFAHLDQSDMPKEIRNIGKFTALVNQAATGTGKAVLAIENYHFLADGPVKNLIENIRTSCFVWVATVLISEQYMEIGSTSSLTAWRRTDQIIAFTAEEIRVYFTALNILMDREMLRAFHELTGGWVQAVILMGKFLPRGEAIGQEHIDQAMNLLYQFFHEEYEISLQPELRQNLILLSMLSSFTLEMVQELTPLTAEHCARLYLDHCFCYGANMNHTRFHKLYQRYLAGMRSEVPKKTQFAFLRKAAAWYDQHGMLIEAVRCYTDCKEYGAVMPILQKRSIPGLTPDEAAQIVACLEAFPESFMVKHPIHRLYLIFAKYFVGDQELALRMQRQLYAQLADRARNDAEDLVLGELHVSEAFQAWTDLSFEFYRHMKAASDLLPDGSTFLDVDEYHFPIGSLLHFRKLHPGDLLQAKEICLESAPYVRKVLPNIGNGACFLAVAEVHLYRCEYGEAMEYANLAVAEGIRTKMWGVIAESYYLLQRIHMATGELDDILAYGQQAADYSKLIKHPPAYSIERITKFHENVYFALYHLLDPFADENPLLHQEGVNHINLGRELYVHAIYTVFARRQYAPALTFLDGARQASHTTGMFFTQLKLLILKSLVYAKIDRPATAAKSLLEAYRISHSNDILFSFIEFGEEMLYLFNEVLPHLKEGELPKTWTTRVLQESEQYQRQRTRNTLEYLRRNPHIRPSKLMQLTKQEYNALKYLATGNTPGETAQIMRVGSTSIYQYLSRAYKKLGVKEKEQAVQLAIAEGILD